MSVDVKNTYIHAVACPKHNSVAYHAFILLCMKHCLNKLKYFNLTKLSSALIEIINNRGFNLSPFSTPFLITQPYDSMIISEILILCRCQFIKNMSKWLLWHLKQTELQQVL